MIKIDRISAPIELTDEVVAAKTAAFKSDHKQVVWRDLYIIKRLLEMSHSKCCYCECLVDEESKYMEVEHFHHKDKYEDEVVKWDNLLPSCKACNVQKGTHDTIEDPIIDPTKQDPRDHLSFYCYQLRGKTDLGKMSEAVLDLNNSKRHSLPRYRVGDKMSKSLAELLEVADDLTMSSPKVSKTRFKNRVIRFLQLCQPDEPYTAIKATVVANDKKYEMVVCKLQSIGLWVEPLITLDSTMRRYQLDFEK